MEIEPSLCRYLFILLIAAQTASVSFIIIDVYPETDYTVILLGNYDFPAGMDISDEIRRRITQ